jgi:hypothetical protein
VLRSKTYWRVLMGFTLAPRLRLGNDSLRLVSVFSGDLTVRCPGLCRTEDLRAVACIVRRITVSNVQPGPIDTDLNPASGDRAVRKRPLRRSTVSVALTTSRRWWLSSPAPTPLTIPGRI